MTKVIILGEQPKEEKKPIEFHLYMDNKGNWKHRLSHIVKTNWHEIVLIERNFLNGYDLFCASSESPKRALFLGHFNDGVVE